MTSRHDHDETAPREQEPERSAESGQLSEGPSGLGTAETSTGGADAVPSTPDNTGADDHDGPSERSSGDTTSSIGSE
jgi:hypothetical protein